MKRLNLMQRSRESKQTSELTREPFTTLDDLLEKARELFDGLKKLNKSRHPLDIRRGVAKGVEYMANGSDSTQIKAGGRTYFFDIEKTKEGKSYLRITESRKGEGDKWERNSLIVFPENAEEFSKAVSSMTAKLA